MSSYGQNPPNADEPQQSGGSHNPAAAGQQPAYGAQPTSPYGQQPAYGSGGYDAPYPSSPGAQQSAKGFLGALFDLSFTTFVTPKIIKVVYVIGLIAIGLATLFFAFSGFFGDSPAVGIVTLVIAPVIGLLYLSLFRMMCEFYLAITRMSEDIHQRLPRG